MNVGIVGCGWIAEKHIPFVKRIRGARIVGIVDSDAGRLEKVSRKYKIPSCYTSVEELLEAKTVDVLHILTPPFSHRDIALKAIQKGIHVYIEKPIALTAGEVMEIYAEAEARGVKVCAGYHLLFEPTFTSALNRIEKSSSGKTVHVESHYGMNMRRYDRMKSTKENEIHWSYDLPGGFHQNYISHPLYLLIKLIGEPKRMSVVSRSGGALPQKLTDEIRVLIDGEKGTGLMSLSYSCEPYQEYLKIFGERQTIEIDWVTMSKITYKNVRLPKAVTKVFYNNLIRAFQLTGNTLRNTVNLLRKKLVPYQGIKTLIEQFYQSIQLDRPVPVPAELAVATEETAEMILQQCSPLHPDFTVRPGSQKNISREESVLVTGASGFVGLYTVKRLIDEGYRVRAFVRKLSYIDRLEDLGVEIHFGDIRNYDSLKAAAEGMDIIVHLAASVGGIPADDILEIAIDGTKNVIRVSEEVDVQRMIYISSMSVYDVADCERDQVLDENHMLERRPEERGAYSLSKTEAEKLILEKLGEDSKRITVLRPSVIFGPEKKVFLNSLGFSLADRVRIIIGPSDGKLRLVHVNDVVQAIVLAVENEISRGKVYNIVHPDRINKREYIKKYVNPKAGRGLNIYVPYFVFYAAAYGIEKIFPLLKRKPFISRYRLLTSQKDVTFDTERIRKDLGWKPGESLDESMRNTFNII